MQHLVQLRHPSRGRKVGLVQAESLALLDGIDSIYRLALAAIEQSQSLTEAIATKQSKDLLDYGPIYEGRSEWRLLPAFDHPDEPACCLVTGTGLTHKASAENRQSMHKDKARPITDSMRMYQDGLEGGRPAPGQIGAQPEWFYKRNGAILRAHGEALEAPCFSLDCGEEAEVAGVYIIGHDGAPRRVGMALGNEFSDHKLESRNYLFLAHSKLRTCALGPELVVTPEFVDARGQVRIVRGPKIIWSKPFATGEHNMSHTLANLEHHHFKYREHRRPGDVHIHFFGADVFSFGEGVQLAHGDQMEIELASFGRPLRNPLRVDTSTPQLISVKPL